MHRTRTRLLAALGLALAALFPVACGGGQADPLPVAQISATLDGTGCEFCHGADGSGGIGPDIRCTSVETLASYVRASGTGHMGGSFPNLTDEDLAAIAAALDTGSCTPAAGTPNSHTVALGGAGILHAPGYEMALTAGCTACHGTDLQGAGTAPSCTACHGVRWDTGAGGGGGGDDDSSSEDGADDSSSEDGADDSASEDDADDSSSDDGADDSSNEDEHGGEGGDDSSSESD